MDLPQCPTNNLAILNAMIEEKQSGALINDCIEGLVNRVVLEDSGIWVK